jgi:acyl transferase domain-containing protein/3-hydroxymyristoyl/3-hydroxydecanoyl-(acyl carrier protein) dehydratase
VSPGAAPIAIVGRACLLPGAASPDELWDAVCDGRDLLSEAPPGRFGVALEDVLCSPQAPAADRTWSDRGGYVTGFEERFDPSGFALSPDRLAELDPLYRWLLHTAREALRDAGVSGAERAGAIFGNLAYPTASLIALANAQWLASLEGPDAVERLGLTRPAAVNRFVAGHPAALLSAALGLAAGSLALDAACASSLYAIKLAADRLARGEAEVMLAGAVCCADSLLIHQGFASLNALSRSGQSRPFHADADGLVPAEGCAFVVLKPLAAAVRDGNRIDAVIRGIGLCNDGSGEGLLVPSQAGQERAMRAALADGGIEAAAVSLLECHATGTPVGDATELASIAAVYGGAAAPPLGSLKSNLGHLITAAGAAGLIKVLEGMRRGIRPPSRGGAEEGSDALARSGMRVVHQPEPWESDGPPLAAVSAFGFGGNDAHLVVEAHAPARSAVAVPRLPPPPAVEIAIVGIGIRAGELGDRATFAEALFAQAPCEPTASGEVVLALDGLRFPPSDLRAALGQQTLVLSCALEAAAEVTELDWEHTGIFIGCETDPDAARYGLRWHLAGWAREWGMDGDWLARARDGVTAPFDSSSTLGAMPNMPANRLNRQFGAQGPSFTVGAGERSGLDALELAAHALRAGELNGALVGAVDLSLHELHEAAAAAVLPAGALPAGDAAVVLALKRLTDARAAGDRVYAVLTGEPAVEGLDLSEGAADELLARFGHAHAADGLVRLAAGALCLHHRALPSGDPWLARERRSVSVRSHNGGGDRGRWSLAADRAPREPDLPGPRFHLFRGADATETLARLERGGEGGEGPACLVLVASSAEELAQRSERARQHLRAGTPAGPGVHFSPAAAGGEVAFVYTAAGAAYHGMGRGLLRALPALGDELTARAPHLPAVMRWVYGTKAPSASDFLWSTSALSQLHTAYTRNLLALQPAAMLGYSSGETNTLFAGGAWGDLEQMYQEIESSGLMERELGGSFDALARRWGAPAQWRMWGVRAPIEEVAAAVATQERVHIAIVNTASDCIVAGEQGAAARVAAAIGSERCRELAYRFVCHVPEVAEVAELWRRIHTRPVIPTPGIRYYTNARNAAYEPSTEACAQALLDQALAPIDFRATVERAYADGVRVFVEHGPAGGCTRWIGEILGERPHLAVALDRREVGFEATLDASAALAAAGVAVDLDALTATLAPRRPPAAPGATLKLPARWPAVRLPPREHTATGAQPGAGADLVVAEPQAMAPAPRLAPVLGSAVPWPPPANGTGKRRQPISAEGLFTHPLSALFERHTGVHELALRRLADAHRAFLQTALAASPAPPATAGAPPALADPPGPAANGAALGAAAPARRALFDRAALELHAGGRISELFGPLFAPQDAFARQVRMPQPPLLLADRVSALVAEPATMGTGTIWTETDVADGAWYLHAGRMPAGLAIESGQADLLLISYLGVDLINRGERVYRLLGCTVTFHGDLPAAGETLAHEITIERHLDHDGVRVFFFHYDATIAGRPAVSVRGGHAGFFTDAELAGSGGVVWSAELAEPCAQPRLERAALTTTLTSFGSERLRAFASGDAHACFGEGFEPARAHVRTPCIQSGRLLLIDEVTELDLAGGPWRRGYLRARTSVSPDEWFFDGHFLGDPCMPGTLMFEATLQCMAFYLAAAGFTLERDGYRFQPAGDEPFVLKCRGQVTPDSRELIYEIFVQELVGGPTPTLYADVLVSADGLKAFHGERIALELVADWPLSTRRELLSEHLEQGRPARLDGVELGYPAMLAAAWGRPSAAFGRAYARFDGARRVARLPGPPYLLISRVTRVEGELGAMAAGVEVECELDITPDAWYFAQNGAATMPMAVLMEAALQPCGWLACYVGCPLSVEEDLAFRNLDGVGTVHAEVTPAAARLRTVARLSGLSANGATIITSFEVRCHLGEELVYELDTVFGFFPHAALEEQVGLPTQEGHRLLLEQPGDLCVALATRPASCFPPAGPALAGPMLLMLDRLTGLWPNGGAHGLGAARAERDVDPGDWYFRAHFFSDPVQPGSLGVEALVQLLQCFMLESGLTRGLEHAHFEPLATARPLRWRYRGQVIPTSRLITTTIELTERGSDERGPFAVCDGSLWVDGRRIYEVSGLAMRAVPDRQKQRLS